jgi:hypothetical protein
MELHIKEAHFHFITPASGHDIGQLLRDVPRPAAPAAPPPAFGGTPILGEYWPGQGGILVATVPAMLGMPARHLIAHTDETSLEWGGYNRETTGAGSHVDGSANTEALIADDSEHPAAVWCAGHEADGHKDFFLPSRFDMLMAYLALAQLGTKGPFNPEGWYWTSTQASRSYGFVQAFAYGDSYWDGKDNEFRVRAFRQVLLNP